MNQYTNIDHSPVQDCGGNNVVILENYRLGTYKTFVFNSVHCLSKLLSELKYLFFTADGRRNRLRITSPELKYCGCG